MIAPVLKPKTYTITLPADEAAKAEILVAEENSSLSQMVAGAIQTLWLTRCERLFSETRAYASAHPVSGYTEADIPRMIAEVRAEMAQEKLESYHEPLATAS